MTARYFLFVKVWGGKSRYVYLSRFLCVAPGIRGALSALRVWCLLVCSQMRVPPTFNDHEKNEKIKCVEEQNTWTHHYNRCNRRHSLDTPVLSLTTQDIAS